MDKLQVVKIGGNVIEDRKALIDFLQDFVNLKGKKILVHGGGKEATIMAKQLGVDVQMIDGRRITDAANLDIATMLYAGKINKTIVAKLQSLNCLALGLSGADGNSIRALKRPPHPIDYGFVGDIEQVNTSLFSLLLNQGYTPVCSAITHDQKGQLLNTNADTIAASLSTALAKEYNVTLSYCFEKKGVLADSNNDSTVISNLNYPIFETMKKSGAIHSGMLPKIHNCFDALKKGVHQVRIGSPKMITENEPHTQILL